MDISITAFNRLNTLISDEPPETGGILGSEKKDIITHIVRDEPKTSSDKFCCYEPDVDFLNKHINEWCNKGIIFKGVFHTHFAGVKTLSCADKKYICAIMKNMPEQISCLYFPVFVLPNRELVCYKAEKMKDNVNICFEDVNIV